MIWNVIKKIIISGMVSWIGLNIFLFIVNWKDWSIRCDLWKDYDIGRKNRLIIISVLLWLSIFTLLTFIILFF